MTLLRILGAVILVLEVSIFVSWAICDTQGGSFFRTFVSVLCAVVIVIIACVVLTVSVIFIIEPKSVINALKIT